MEARIDGLESAVAFVESLGFKVTMGECNDFDHVRDNPASTFLDFESEDSCEIEIVSATRVVMS